MKLSCKVIEDLLPLYHDGACSQESRALVEEHLADCPHCSKLLSQMDDEVTLPAAESEVKPLAEIKSRWNKEKKKALLKGIIAATLVIAVLIGGCAVLTEWKWKPVSADKISLSNVAELPDGVIMFQLNIDDDRMLRELHYEEETEDGVLYLVPKRAVFEKKTEKNGFGSLNHMTFYIAISGLTRQEWETYSSDPAYEEIMAENSSPGLADIFPPADVKKICVGSKKDYVVLWEEGMELPAATEEQIEWYENGRR